MKERGIAYSPPMVLARRAGLKTQTRRVVHGVVHWVREGPRGRIAQIGDTAGLVGDLCPHGKPGDRLWVREPWRAPAGLDDFSPAEIGDMAIAAGYRSPWCPIEYEADKERRDWRGWGGGANDQLAEVAGRYRHARFMPRWASRGLDEVVEVRVERLQDISEADALAEGVRRSQRAVSSGAAVSCFWDYLRDQPGYTSARDSYASLWESINGAGSWDANPWVWAISFKVLTP